MQAIEFTIPLKASTTLNSRVHWSVRHKAAKREKYAVHMAWAKARPKLEPTLRVTLTRIGPRQLDGDNLQGALKGIRDGLAIKLKTDDGSALIEWAYAQELGEYGVRVKIQRLLPPPEVRIVPIE